MNMMISYQELVRTFPSPEDYEVSITGKGKVLELSFWGNTRSKKDALVLLKDMTKWMDSKIRT